MIFYGMN